MNLSLLQFRFQHQPELLLRAIQLRLHGAQRKLQRLGELFVSRAVKVVRGDEEPVIRGQADDGFLQAIPQLEIAEPPIRHRRRRSPVHAIVVKRDRRFSTRLILGAYVCDDAINPGGQTRFPAEVWQSTVDPQEHVLGQIFGPGPILHGAGNQREHQIFEAVDQLLERALIAGTAALDELALVDSLHPPTY